MGRVLPGILLLIVMIGLIVGLDVTLLRDHVVLRLIVNVGIVLACGAIYLRFIARR